MNRDPALNLDSDEYHPGRAGSETTSFASELPADQDRLQLIEQLFLRSVVLIVGDRPGRQQLRDLTDAVKGIGERILRATGSRIRRRVNGDCRAFVGQCFHEVAEMPRE
jgi:hypothetical protein